MTVQRHGLSIGLERANNQIFVSITACGKLTHDDYQHLTPVLDSALQGVAQPDVKLLFDATAFEGWEARAAWDDFKIGLKHGNAFSRIALVGHHGWQEWAAKIGSWFISGEIRSFTSYDEALNWLLA